MKLTDLEPSFKKTIDQKTMRDVDTLAEAQGIMFLCPHCYRENDGPKGTHSVLIWFEGRGVPPEWHPPARWQVKGTGYEDLTISPSIFNHGCWHGFIIDGGVTFC